MTNLDDILAISNRRRAEVEALRAENERLRANLDGLIQESRSSTEAMDRARAKIDELRADNERLRRQCEELFYGPECPNWPDCDASLGRAKDDG
jgi:uncharacterized coiled-coil DUF342 family protein